MAFAFDDETNLWILDECRFADINTQIYLADTFENWSSDGYLDGIELHVGDDSSSGKQSLMKLEDFSDLTFNML